MHETDAAEHAAHLMRRTALAEGIAALADKLVPYGDNGATPQGHHGAGDAPLKVADHGRADDAQWALNNHFPRSARCDDRPASPVGRT